MHGFKFVLGIGVWAGLFFGVMIGSEYIEHVSREWRHDLEDQDFESWLESRSSEISYLSNPVDLEVSFPDWRAIRAGDKVFFEEQLRKPTPRPVGVVYATKFYWEPKKRYAVCIRLYEEQARFVGDHSRFYLYKQPADPAWVIKTILPKNRRRELVKMLQAYWKRHWRSVKREIWPMLADAAKESYHIVQKNFAVVMEQHKERLVKRLRLVIRNSEADLLPMWQEVVWPILLERAEPVLDPIVKDMWKKFPKGKLVWLYIYQSLPYTHDDHVRKLVEKYIEQEVVPLLEEHRPKLKEVSVEVAKELAKEPRVKEALKEALMKVLRGEELIAIIKAIFVELVEINKGEVVQKVRQKWDSPELQHAVSGLKGDFDSLLVRMINHVVLEKKNHIRSEFAEVLRRQILAKGKYCVVVEKDGEHPLTKSEFSGKLGY